MTFKPIVRGPQKGAPPLRPLKIDLNAAPSAMERLAATWRRDKADG